MSFFFLGTVIFILGIFFLQRSVRQQDREGAIGSIMMIIAGIILIIFFGLLYRGLTLLGT